ncbi:hypothetical protein ACOSQ3_027006 [Xanthoceras sorbifolium]
MYLKIKLPIRKCQDNNRRQKIINYSEAVLGNGDNAKIIRKIMITTGARSITNGGGGSGGNKTGSTRSDAVNTTITTINVLMHYKF